MTLDGSFTIAAPRTRVWDSIRNPAVVAACVPGCNGYDVVSPNSYRATVGASIGPITVSFDLMIEIAGEQPPEKLTIRARGAEGGRASMLSSVSVVSLREAEGTSTEVHYTSDLSITGRIGKFGLGVMRKKADQISRTFAERFAEALRAETAS